jgi:hypothetical protein
VIDELDELPAGFGREIEVEKIRAARARLSESCEAVAAAVCRLLEERGTAERLRVLNAGVEGG